MTLSMAVPTLSNLEISPLRPNIAILIPCYNEEVAIGKVVSDFRAALPEARIYVYDNNSIDRTSEVATAAGAVVRKELLKGKGNVVRRMFADVEADIYILVDGDDTYEAAAAPKLTEALLSGPYDMVTGRREGGGRGAYRPGHRFGNRILTGLVAFFFGNRVSDILSGYRAFSRRFVKSFPALSAGFEIETELTVHALELRMPIAEVPTQYSERPEGSSSKLNTIRDGVRILWTIIMLLKEERALKFFLSIAVFLAGFSLLLAWPILTEFWQTGLVPRLPTAVLATGIMLVAFLSATCGLILDSVTRSRREIKRMQYLTLPAPRQHNM